MKSQEIIDSTVDELLKDGIVIESDSEWASTVLLVKKKTGETRLCADYRAVNKVLRRDEWPLPKIIDILDTSGKSKFFSVLDLKAGFHKIRMAEDSKKITSFITKKGLYEYNYMSFGLCTNPSAFSRFLHKIFRDMVWNEIIYYIDDVIISAITIEERNRILEEFLMRCWEVNLTLNLKKCEILKTSVLYLGYVISGEGLRANPKKIEIVKNHPTPKD